LARRIHLRLRPDVRLWRAREEFQTADLTCLHIALAGPALTPREGPRPGSAAERAGFEPPSSGIEPSQTASLPVVEEVNTLPKTPPGDAPDHSGTNARTALISTLSTHVGALTAAGDIAAAKVAAEALVHLLGLPPVADTSTRPP
jgi:hypothetical protein